MSAKSRLEMLGNLQIVAALIFLFAVGWFFDRALGGLLNVLILTGMLFWAAQYLFALYDLDSRLDAFGELLTFMFKVNLPHVIVGEGHVLKKSGGTRSGLGGPGLIVVKNDSAVVIEVGNMPKVLGPGAHLVTKGSETIKEVVDLRPQTRAGSVEAMTKDGVNIELPFSLGFQIGTGGRQPSDEEPYPFSEQSVIRAVYRSKLVGATGAEPWHERIPGIVLGNIQEMIATHYLEDLFEPDRPGSNPRPELREWLMDASRNAAETIGAQLNWIGFATPKIPDETTRKIFATWRTKQWAAAAQVEDSRVTADRMQQLTNTLLSQGLTEGTVRAILTEVFRARSAPTK